MHRNLANANWAMDLLGPNQSPVLRHVYCSSESASVPGSGIIWRDNVLDILHLYLSLSLDWDDGRTPCLGSVR
jgi:hypothetical protein